VFAPFQEPRKPNDVLAPAPSVLFQAVLRTETDGPVTVNTPFQLCVTVWPLVNAQLTCQPLRPDAPAVTVTWPWKPPGHWVVVTYVAVHVRAPGLGLVLGLVFGLVFGLVLRLGDALGLADRLGLALVLGDGVVPPPNTTSLQK